MKEKKLKLKKSKLESFTAISESQQKEVKGGARRAQGKTFTIATDVRRLDGEF